MTFVRGQDGKPLLCAWDDCEKSGHNEIRHIDVDQKLTYIFCHGRHRLYWLQAHLPGRYGQLPAGAGRRSPLGLILPN